MTLSSRVANKCYLGQKLDKTENKNNGKPVLQVRKMSFLFKVHRTSRVRKYSTKTRYAIVVTSGRASGEKRAGGGTEWGCDQV